MIDASQILEALMLACFGLSWPFNAYKSWCARTARGANWQFFVIIMFGYCLGIAAKFVAGNISWVLVVYILNILVVFINLIVYVRNRRLDKRADALMAKAARVSLGTETKAGAHT